MSIAIASEETQRDADGDTSMAQALTYVLFA